MLWGKFFPDDFRKNLKYCVGASGYTYTRLHEVEEYKNVDILFVGSSHAYRGFDPRIFKAAGFTSFNLGTSSQTPVQTAILLDRYLDSLNPKTVVYEVYPYTFSSDGVESSVDVIANSIIDRHSFKMAFKLNHLKTYNTLAYGFLSQLFSKGVQAKENLSFATANSSFRDSTSYVPGGFTDRRREWEGINGLRMKEQLNEAPGVDKKGIMTDISIIQTRKGKWDPRNYQLDVFESILKKLQNRNIRIVLVQAPINSKYYQLIQCNKEIDSYFSSKGEYYNFNEMMHFDNEMEFIDYDHLNQNGVKKMNEALIEKAFKKN